MRSARGTDGRRIATAAPRAAAAATLALACLTAWASPSAAEVLRVEVTERALLLEGRSFGDAGSYEKLVGWVEFGFDPDDPANAAIVDLGLAPREEDGLVHARANFMVLQAVDPDRRSGVGLLEVSNRGGKAALGYLNGGRFSRDPTTAEELGDGLLMRRGATVIWVGWQWDVPPDEEGLLRLSVPVARAPDGARLRGLVRADRVVGEPTRSWYVGHRGHRAYPVVDTAAPEIRLTVRDGREAERRLVPESEWSWAHETEEGEVVASRSHVWLPAGFEPGRIYELVYPAEDPRVVGLGLAAIRDMMSYAKHDPASPFPVREGVALGISQTGRFLRHFLYQGFNLDERDRKVFDGMMVHTAGAGRGSFNHRFAQPSRDAHRFSAFFYPTDLVPFSGRVQRDSVTGRRDGLLAAYDDLGDLPTVFYTNTGYEYWGRAASLLHASLAASADVEPLPPVRIYHLASAQHVVDRFPPTSDRRLTGPDEPAAWRGNPLDFLVNLRALFVRMEEHLLRGEAPPPSRFPRLADGTLVTHEALSGPFPDVPGLPVPEVIHVAYRADYGPRWEEGIVEVQPPELGPAFPSLVAAVDSLGNERAGVRNVAIRAPLATYTPWSTREGLPGPEGELADFRGSFAPLPWDADAARATGDPRPAVLELHADRAAYLERVRSAARDLVEEGFLLEEDVDRVVGRAEALWRWMEMRSEADGGS